MNEDLKKQLDGLSRKELKEVKHYVVELLTSEEDR